MDSTRRSFLSIQTTPFRSLKSSDKLFLSGGQSSAFLKIWGREKIQMTFHLKDPRLIPYSEFKK